MEPSAGIVIANRYVLTRLIGHGGMGAVWAADDMVGGNAVALKFVRDTCAPATLRRRLLREAKAASTVRHPAVVQVHDVFELDDGTPALVMEFLEGESLADRLARDGEIPLGELCGIMQPVVSAVGAAHALGVIHRDLKPANIFLARGRDGVVEVKILDFGIAKLAPSDSEAATSTELTRTGAMLGTPCYMAPEQIYGEKDLDHRVDVWALGMILFEALSGILPTRAENLGQVMKIITTRAIWPLEQIVPTLPRDLTALVNRMLERDRARRPQDLREVRSTLAAHTKVVSAEFGPPVTAHRDGERIQPAELEHPARAPEPAPTSPVTPARCVSAELGRAAAVATAGEGATGLALEPSLRGVFRGRVRLAALVAVALTAGGGWAWLSRPAAQFATAPVDATAPSRRATALGASARRAEDGPSTGASGIAGRAATLEPSGSAASARASQTQRPGRAPGQTAVRPAGAPVPSPKPAAPQPAGPPVASASPTTPSATSKPSSLGGVEVEAPF